MRISSNQLVQGGLSAILDQQARIARTQEQISTGRRVVRAADDPAAASRLVLLRQETGRIDQYQRNIGSAASRLAFTESLLGSATGVLDRLRELALQANNSTQSQTTRELVRHEVLQLRDELLNLANSRHGEEYVFSGNRTATPPFSVNAAGVTGYGGDDGHRVVSTGAGTRLQIGEPGTEVFFRIPTGNGTIVAAADPGNVGSGIISPAAVVDPAAYTPDSFSIRFTTSTSFEIHNDTTATLIAAGQTFVGGATIDVNGAALRIDGSPAAGDRFVIEAAGYQDVFATIHQLAEALLAPSSTPADRARLHGDLSRVVENLDQAQAHLTAVRARMGARLGAASMQQDFNVTHLLQLEEAISAGEDLDYAEAVSRLSRQVTVLEAAQQVLVRIQSLSLFNFLR
jgi:flagellar hook-associated protein 3 FlgL